MNRRWIAALAAAVVVVAFVSPAQAQRGRRGVTMTPFGPMPGGMSMDAYSNLVQQRQTMMMMQQQAKMEQAMLKQMQQDQKKKDSSKDKDKDKDKSKADDASKTVKRPLTLEERRKLERERLDAARAKLGLDKPKDPAPPKGGDGRDKPLKPSAADAPAPKGEK